MLVQEQRWFHKHWPRYFIIFLSSISRVRRPVRCVLDHEQQMRVWVWVLCCLMTPGLSTDIRCHIIMTMLFSVFAHHQRGYQAMCETDWQPGDCRQPLWSSSRVCGNVWANILTLSLLRVNSRWKPLGVMMNTGACTNLKLVSQRLSTFLHHPASGSFIVSVRRPVWCVLDQEQHMMAVDRHDEYWYKNKAGFTNTGHITSWSYISSVFRVRRPVRCVLDRDQQMRTVGGRNECWYKYKAGFTSTGQITALDITVYADGGCTLDLSEEVSNDIKYLAESFYVQAYLHDFVLL